MQVGKVRNLTSCQCTCTHTPTKELAGAAPGDRCLFRLRGVPGPCAGTPLPLVSPSMRTRLRCLSRTFCPAHPQRSHVSTHTHTHTHTNVHPARDSHIPDFTGRPEATPTASRRYRQNYDKLHKYVQIVRMMSCAQGPPEPAERRSGRSAQDLLCIQLRQLHPICLHLPRRQAHRLIPIAFTGLCPSRTGLQGLALRKALGPARGTPRTPRGIGDSVWGSRVLGGCSKVPARVPWGTRRMSLVTCAR